MAEDREGICTGPAGFTLVEMIAALVLVGILTAVAGMGIVMGTRGYVFTRGNVNMTHKGQLALDRLARELHAMTSLQSETFSVTGASQPYMIFDTINGRRAIRKIGGEVRLYRLVETDTSITGGGDILVDKVAADASGFDLEYFQIDPADSNEWLVWTAGTDGLERLYRIDIDLVLHQPNDPDEKQKFETTVYPRNILRET